jgi:5'-deoxynucleotidase YfbR-like HD superfamily hydrolase
VAQHSVLVSRYVSPENQLWALLHDAPETYVNDVSSPLKKLIQGNYQFFHDLFMQRICEKFGLPYDEPAEVKKWDKILTQNELWTLIDDTDEADGVPELFDHLETWSAEEAKAKFYKRFEELK